MRKLSNNQRERKIISFSTYGLSPRLIQYLEQLSKTRTRNTFITNAINQRHFYLTQPKQFIQQLIELNFGLVRHLLRKIGRKK